MKNELLQKDLSAAIQLLENDKSFWTDDAIRRAAYAIESHTTPQQIMEKLREIKYKLDIIHK